MYYYLDGLNKLGPYTSGELKSRNLSPETLIFEEGKDNWIAIKDIPKLYELLFEEDNKLLEGENEYKDGEKKIKIPAVLLLLVAILIGIILSKFIVNIEKVNDFKIIQDKVESIFKGKDEVCDYYKLGVKVKKIDIDKFTPKDNNGNSFIEYYQSGLSYFIVLSLTKMNNGFEKLACYSGDIGYKVSDSKYVPGLNFGPYYTPGYTISNGRSSIEEAYNEALNYLTKEKENKSYLPGCYDKIEDFFKLCSEYYFIANVTPDDNTSKSSSLRTAYVFNDEWVVFYKFQRTHYEIIENKKIANIRWLEYSLISTGIILLLYSIIKYRKVISL